MFKHLVIACLLVGAFGICADARTHGGVANSGFGLCPQGTFTNSGGISDGCPTAPAGTPNNITLFQHSDFFSGYAAQSGQAYTTRPGWNVAGVDYPVGIPAAKAATLIDPATYGAPAWAALGCTYSATGNNLGGPLLSCNLLSTSTGDYVLDNFDFSGSLNGHTGGCVAIGFNTSRSLTISNSYFAMNAGCFGNSNPSGGTISNNNAATQIFTSNPTTLTMTNNVFDYSPVRTGVGSQMKPVSIGAVTTMIAKYNAFINIPQNPLNGSAGNNFNLLMAYNYVDGYVFDSTHQNHAEVTDFNGVGVRPTYYWYFNTILRTNQANPGSGTAQIWLSSTNSADGSVFTDGRVLNNTAVVNCYFDTGTYTCGSNNPVTGGNTTYGGLGELDNTGTNVNVSDNFYDGTGATVVWRVSNTTCTNLMVWTGNKSLVTGSTISAATGIVPTGTTPANGSGAGSCA